MAIVRANDIDFQVSQFRSGPPGERPAVVAIHGLGIVDGASMSMTVGLPLAKHFEVTLYDLRGHGRTQFVPSGFRVVDHVGDLLAILDVLDIDRPVHLVTGSYGGTIGITTALHHPERVASLSMIDPMFPLPDWGTNLALSLEYYQSRFENATIEEIMEILHTTARRRAKMLAERGRKLFYETTLLEDVRSEQTMSMDDYARIGCPVMAVFGKDSDIWILNWLLQDLIKGTQIVEVPDADHITVFSKPQTRDAIVEFVNRIEAERALRDVPLSSNGVGGEHA